MRGVGFAEVCDDRYSADRRDRLGMADTQESGSAGDDGDAILQRKIRAGRHAIYTRRVERSASFTASATQAPECLVGEGQLFFVRHTAEKMPSLVYEHLLRR